MRHKAAFRAASLCLAYSALSATPATAAPPPDWSHAERLDVKLSEYRFKPGRLEFEQGKVYDLHLENRGKEMHEFTAPEFFKTLDIKDASPLNGDRVEIEVAPGAVKDLVFVAQKPGTYQLRCSDHDWAGMKGQITVK
ncbi:MAG: cupredoxin domain-containing protein [Alphaproteobacteria bacterium]|nr:cupredoxin domain-containing protein [Alphaproteobacteria bacterium]